MWKDKGSVDQSPNYIRLNSLIIMIIMQNDL